jgi:exoribonuclease R
MNQYEYYYRKNIEKLYNKEDNYELKEGDIIEDKIERVDLTHLEIYSIDPENCEDVDDTFSYNEDELNKYVGIHIADPTSIIDSKSDLFKNIIEKAFTNYPSNRKPKHLMPNIILNKCSLHENEYGNIKNAISLIIRFDKKNHYKDSSLYFSKIKVKIENKLSYNNVPENNNNIKECLKLSYELLPNLVYNNDIKLEIKYKDGKPYFHKNSEKELEYKKMIAKFAVFTNNYVAYLLKKHLENDYIIFRNCPIINKMENIDNFNDFMNFILNNNVKADYNNKNSNHDILELNEYLHMTSPLRRSVDCVIHYILKSIINQDELPFTKNEIEEIINKSNIINKKLKKIQFNDNKFRLLHTMELNNENQYKIGFYISSYMKPYVNIIIYKLNDYNIYISYTLKNVFNKTFNNDLLNKKYEINIDEINCCNYYDIGKLPQLDNFIYNII